MPFNKDKREAVWALMPFTIAGAELLLVPNKRSGADPRVLLVARARSARLVKSQLTLAEARRLATYLNAAANEAETLGKNQSSQHASRNFQAIWRPATGSSRE